MVLCLAKKLKDEPDRIKLSTKNFYKNILPCRLHGIILKIYAAQVHIWPWTAVKYKQNMIIFYPIFKVDFEFPAQYPMLNYFFAIKIMRYYNKTASTWQVGRKSAAGRLAQLELRERL